MNANWYDLLDVDPTASAGEIRTAWKSAVAEIDPTDRTFRVYTQAGEVLLDPASRAAYDARLAADRADQREADPVPAPVADFGLTPEDVSTGGNGLRLVPSWLLIGLALLTLLVSAGALAVGFLRPSDQAVADATTHAEAAAQRASAAIFSYDYQRLDADHEAAAGFMTADYRKRYDPLFEVIEQNAPALKTATEASFIASGVVRSGQGADADDRVQVFVIFDQLTTNKARTTPSRTPAFATLTMERQGDTWLVDDVQGPPVAG